VQLDLKDFKHAKKYLNEALALRRDIGEKRGIFSSLLDLGKLAFYQKDIERSAILFALSEALLHVIGAQLPPREAKEYGSYRSDVIRKLDKKKFASIKAEAGKIPIEDAIAYALQ
ncbi:hypothetical protein C6A37_10355, partial [Desulfobacteraceae bacterium SEEP-SAG9]